MRRAEFDEIKQEQDFYSQRDHEESCFKYYCLGYEKALDTKVYSRRKLEQQLSKAQADLKMAVEALEVYSNSEHEYWVEKITVDKNGLNIYEIKNIVQLSKLAKQALAKLKEMRGDK